MYKSEVRRINNVAERMTMEGLEKKLGGIEMEDEEGKNEGGKVGVKMLIEGVIECRMCRK